MFHRQMFAALWFLKLNLIHVVSLDPTQQVLFHLSPLFFGETFFFSLFILWFSPTTSTVLFSDRKSEITSWS